MTSAVSAKAGSFRVCDGQRSTRQHDKELLEPAASSPPRLPTPRGDCRGPPGVRPAETRAGAHRACRGPGHWPFFLRRPPSCIAAIFQHQREIAPIWQPMTSASTTALRDFDWRVLGAVSSSSLDNMSRLQVRLCLTGGCAVGVAEMDAAQLALLIDRLELLRSQMHE